MLNHNNMITILKSEEHKTVMKLQALRKTDRKTEGGEREREGGGGGGGGEKKRERVGGEREGGGGERCYGIGLKLSFPYNKDCSITIT